MTARKTSAATYRKIQNNGLLSQRRWEVYSELYRHGPLTAGELSQWYLKDRMYKNNVSTRLTELVKMGVVTEAGESVCAVTGQTVIQFETTNSLPTKIKRSPTKLDLAYARIMELEVEVSMLRQKQKSLRK